MTQTTATATDFHWSRGSLKLLLGFSAFLCLLGLPALISPAWDMRLFGVALVVGFFWLCRSVWGRLHSREPVISVDAAGLFDRRSARSPYAWDELKSVAVIDIEGMAWVGLEFHDRKTALARAGALTRLAEPLQRLMGLPPVTLNMSLLDGTAQDLVLAVARWRPDLTRP